MEETIIPEGLEHLTRYIERVELENERLWEGIQQAIKETTDEKTREFLDELLDSTGEGFDAK